MAHLSRRIGVRLGRLHSHIDGIIPFVRLDNAQVFSDLVIALRTPRNIAT